MLFADLAVWLAAWVFIAGVPFTGDERFYASTATVIAEFLTGERQGAFAVADRVVHNGWFMPGMSLLLVPLQLLFGGPGTEVTRAYIALINLGLWLWALHEVERRIGPKSAAALMVFPPLALMWQMFASTLWTDLPAGLLICIATARIYEISVRSMRADEEIGWRALAGLELVLVAAVYLRGSVIAFVIAVHIFLLAIWLISSARWQMLRRTSRLLLAFPVFAGLLAPWSGLASWQLGSPVAATSTIPLSLAITFGPNDRVCFGRCPEGNIWHSAAEFSRTYAERQQISELEAQRQMAAHTLSVVSWDRYWGQVTRNVQTFATQPGWFAHRFVRHHGAGLSDAATRVAIASVQWATLLIYAPFMLALVAANAAVIRRDLAAQLGSLAIKMATLCIFVQPFVHPSHQRYWPLFAPLAAVALGWLLGDRLRPSASLEKDSRARGHIPTLTFSAIQVGYVVLSAAVSALILYSYLAPA